MTQIKGTMASADQINTILLADDPTDRVFIARSIDGLMLRQESDFVFLTHEQCIALRDYMITGPWRDKETD